MLNDDFVACQYFTRFVEGNYDHDPTVFVFYTLFIAINQFTRSCLEMESPKARYDLAVEILKNYLNDGAPYQINLDKELDDRLRIRFLEFQKAHELMTPSLSEKSVDSIGLSDRVTDSKISDLELFGELYAFVISKLQTPFEQFKQSKLFVEMEDYRAF